MAIDTQAKRASVLAARFGRLPFGRRFRAPFPDGTIAQADRQHLAGLYAGISALVIAPGPSIQFIDRPYHVYVPGDSRREVFVPGDDRRFVKPGELPVP